MPAALTAAERARTDGPHRTLRTIPRPEVATTLLDALRTTEKDQPAS